MGKSIGIDLGTTNTVAAVMEGSKPKVILNASNESLTRSVVYMSKDNEPMVGSKAFDKAGAEPESTVISVKRLVGRQYDDEQIQRAKKRYQYSIEKNPNGSDAAIKLRDKYYSPTEISAMILHRIKDDAEKKLGEEITHAVITVPAYFDPIQKEQTRLAGEMAGFRVKNIISEPTAAAIAYHLDQDEDTPRTLVVYDLGGGTFDISCLISQSEMFTELDKEGDMWLGGDDFDQAIIDHCVEYINREHHYDPTGNRKLMFSLKKYAEVAKKELSEMSSTEVMLDNLKLSSGDTVDVCIPITRMNFERLIKTKINETISMTEKALKASQLTPDQVDCVLVVGGSTSIPLVRSSLIEHFGEDKITQNVNAMECVAIGAAKLAQDMIGITCPRSVINPPECDAGFLNPLDATTCEKCGHPLKPEMACPQCGRVNPLEVEVCECGYKLKLTDVGAVIPQAIGIELEGDRYSVIMPKNAPFPSPEAYLKQFATASDAQTTIDIHVYEGECLDDIKKNRFLGTGRVPLGEHVPAKTPVDVSIKMDRDGALLCEAKVHYGNVEPFNFRIDQSIEKPVAPEPGGGAHGDFSGGDIEISKPLDWRSEVGIFYYINIGSIVVNRYVWLLPDSKATELRKIVADLESSDENNNETLGRAAAIRAEAWSSENGVAWMLGFADLISQNPKVSPQNQAALGNCLSAISQAMTRGDTNAATAQLQELDKHLANAMKDLNEGPAPKIGSSGLTDLLS